MSKLNGKNKNTLVVSIMSYGAEILAWDKNELEEMDRKTSTFMSMSNIAKKCGCAVVFPEKMVEEDLLDVKTV